METPPRHYLTRRTFTAALGSALLVSAASPALAAPPHAPDPVLEWFDLTDAAALAPNQFSVRTWAVAWSAGAQAIGPRGDGSFARAAFASAVHGCLVVIAPGLKADLDAALDRSLARLPSGPAKAKGVEAGQAAAARVLVDREGDGLDLPSVNEPYTPPPPAPGVWRPTPPGYRPGVLFGMTKSRPFLMSRPDQFRPGPPPALTSSQYARDFAEVKVLGAADSTERTEWQTNIAQLWRPGTPGIWNKILRQVVEQATPRNFRDRVRLVAAFQMATLDSAIATFEVKYHYATWRPVTAIEDAAEDGNPHTEPPPTTWSPLMTTPEHPEYVSGHCAYSGTAAAVLTAFVGPAPARPVTLTSRFAPGFVRTYTTWAQMLQDVNDARVWGGIHFRFSDEAGIRMGTKIALYGLRHLPW